MKKTLIVSFLLLFSFKLISQEKGLSLGFSGGTTFSIIKVKDYVFNGGYDFSLGFGGELFCALNLSPHVLIKTNFGILQRGSDYRYETPIITVDAEMENSYFGLEFKADDYYLNNDWLVGYQFGDKIIVMISGGFYYSYYLNSKNYYRSYLYIDPSEYELIGDPELPIGYSENEDSSTGRNQYTHDWDFGIVGSACLGYHISEKLSIIVSAKYHHGLYDRHISEQAEEASIYNRSIVTFVGIMIRIY